MKKIISVALSTAMAFSMFASVAFGDTLTAQDKFDALKAKGVFTGYPDGTAQLGAEMTRAEFAKVISKIMGLKETLPAELSYNDKNYNAKHWAAPYIEAVTAAGIMQGKDLTKKMFDPTGHVTVQEMATIIVKALDLPASAGTIDNTATEWAQADVQALIDSNLGLVTKDTNFQAYATRTLLVEGAYAAEIALSVPAVVEATKVTSVSADNLKEVNVAFDGEVDKATAQLKDNYKLSGGKTIKSAVLNDAKNLVVLTLEDDISLSNQVKYTLSVSAVKAGSKTISASNIEFSPVDSSLPEVVSVTGLGTKAVKVVFSEPIKQSFTGSFMLDGQGFYGSPSVDNRELVIRSNSDLTVGEHTLTVTGIEDFSGLKSLKSEHKFTVVEDKTLPTIAEATGTLEKLTVTFSEDIDDSTLDIDKVYHKRGDSKIKPSKKVKIAGNKYEFYFSNTNALPSYETTIFVEGVKDYSGNEIKETSKLVKAEIDTERPTVLDSRVTAGNKQQLAITFSKDLASNQKWTDLITVKDKDGKIRQVSTVEFKDSDSHHILLVNFFSDLPEGTNTLDIRGIKDNTVLGNVLLDYSTTFSVNDSGKPKVVSASFKLDNTARRAVIVFSEKMDTATLTNKANYILNFNSNLIGLPNDSSISITQDGKAVVIDLPVEIDGVEVNTTTWTDIKVQGVKDLTGNYIENYYKDLNINLYSTLHTVDYNDAGKTASLTGTREIKVKLDQAVSKVNNKLSVKLNGNAVQDVVANNTDVITIKLTDAQATYSPNGLSLTFTDTQFVGVAQNVIGLDNTTATVSGPKVVTINSNIEDAVAPEVKPLDDTVGNLYYAATATGSTYTVLVDASENLQSNVLLNDLYASDLIVTRLTGDNKVVPVFTHTQTDFFYTVSISNDVITVVITDDNGANAEYSITVKSDAKYIQDIAGKVIAGKSAVRTRIVR